MHFERQKRLECENLAFVRIHENEICIEEVGEMIAIFSKQLGLLELIILNQLHIHNKLGLLLTCSYKFIAFILSIPNDSWNRRMWRTG